MILNVLLTILIGGLCTFILAYMLTKLGGPFDVFKQIRMLAGIHYNDDEVVLVENKFFAKLLECIWCTSTWVAAVVSLYLIWLTGLPWHIAFVIWLGSITLSGMVNKFVET
jgi:hypothetical protein